MRGFERYFQPLSMRGLKGTFQGGLREEDSACLVANVGSRRGLREKEGRGWHGQNGEGLFTDALVVVLGLAWLRREHTSA